METYRRLLAAGFVGASVAYIVTVISFTGTFDVFQWSVFMVVFFITYAGFERSIRWVGTRE